VASQAVIFSVWGDAWSGTVAQCAPAHDRGVGWRTEGPPSFHAQYLRDAHVGLARVVAARSSLKQTWSGFPIRSSVICASREVWGSRACRTITCASRPHPARARFPLDAIRAEQQSFADKPTRLFLMRARMFGVPFEAFHRAVGGHATHAVTVAGTFPLENAHGDEMDRAETVTLFNDMCLPGPRYPHRSRHCMGGR